LIGGKDTEEGIKAQNLLKRIYSYWIPDDKIILMNLWSAELSKLVFTMLNKMMIKNFYYIIKK